MLTDTLHFNFKRGALPVLLAFSCAVAPAVAEQLSLPAYKPAVIAQNDPPAAAPSTDVPAPAAGPAPDPGHSSALFAASDKLAVPTDLGATPSPSDLPAPTPAAPSQNVTINLINKLVAKGILSQTEAADMIKQAEAEAVAAKDLAAQVAPPSDDTVRVTYIPENVKAEIRDQLRDDVMAQARDEHWATPNTFPEWTNRVRVFGDFRMRWESDLYPKGNDNTGAFPNFNAINTGSPFDTSGTVFSPQRNVDQNRERLRIAAHFGVDVNLEDNFTMGIRLGTGDSSTPVSANQSLGLANQGQGGDFSKYSIWLDRAFLKYEVGGQPTKNLAFMFGRFDNPFFASTMIWDQNIGFDGIAFTGKYEILSGFTPFLTAGAFPVFNTDLNFSSNQPSKFKSSDKWLYAGQVGFDLKVAKDINAKFGVAYYDFVNIEGKLSDPFTPLTPNDQGNTDDTRPSFAQTGNTYMALRNIVPSSLNNYGTSMQYQYFGLATPFRELAYTGKIDFNSFEPVQISLFGEYVKNIAFNAGDINAIAVNNRGPNPVPTPAAAPAAGAAAAAPAPPALAPFAGGNVGWLTKVQIGKSAFEKRGDWNASLGYRYVESDAVVDGFTDSDFATGATNIKGITIGAAVALSPRVKFGVTWMSGTQIAGPPSKVDVLQVDLSAKF